MELNKASVDYSLKCIPIPHNDSHRRSTINKTEQFLQRLRWKVHFFENPSHKPEKETFGFTTHRNAPQSASLVNFENDLTHLISNLEYSNQRTAFQNQLTEDVKKIRKSKDIFVNADKTSNVYRVDKETYNKLMRDNVTANYETADPTSERSINMDAKYITQILEISERVEPIVKRSAYITLKDHKENFPNEIKCRLINPTKSNIGKISKQLLQQINEKIRTQLNLQQWRSTSDTLTWFKNIKEKARKKFIQLDIVDFYPSITEELFETAIDFASEITPVSNETRNILRNARQSILFHNNTVWNKTTGLFDVTMGSYDGCEVCELVGLYIIHKIKEKFPEIDFGLYRDDGLGTIQRAPKTKLRQIQNNLSKLFKEELGLAITVSTDLTIVNYLDVTLDLQRGKYYPFRKPNDHPIYIHKESNHPPHVAKQLPKSINKRLSEISSDEDAFNGSKAVYEKALRDSGHGTRLKFDPATHNNKEEKTKRTRKRNIIWFTPPYSASLTTNIGKEFLKLIDKNFPINNPLHKIINKRTVKLSYSCTQNMQTIIRNHNNKVLNETIPDPSTRCNCQIKTTCPVPGECCQKTVVYRATLQHDTGSAAQYIGSTEGEFKRRYNNHKKSFKHEQYKSETTLSKHVWNNSLNPTPQIKWEYLKKCKTYDVGDKSCDLCLSEKEFIVKNLHQTSLINKRADIGNKCPHRRKKTLSAM